MIEVACAIIINDQNLILCCQRSADMQNPLKWEFPGGKLEQNESAEACLIREIKEELYIDVEIVKEMHAREFQYPEKSIKLIPFICRHLKGEIKLKEHTDYKFVNIKDLLNLDWLEADIQIVKDYLKLHQ